jgi:hypothetical protein
MTSRILVLGATLVSLAVTVACSRPQESPPPDPVQLAALDLVLAEPPQGWVIEDGGAEVRLSGDDETTVGTLTLSVRSEFDANLVAAVEHHREAIEAAGDTYFGRQELVTQLGTALTSRGERTTNGATVGETLIVALHPRQDGIIHLVARYPSDEAPSAQVQAAIDVFALIE